MFFTPQISVFSPNTGKCGPEKTPYLDTFHAVLPVIQNLQNLVRWPFVT